MNNKEKKTRINSISGFSNIIINLLFIIITILCVVPLLLVISVSFTPENNLTLEGYKLIPSKISLYAYKYVFADYQRILRGYGITTFVTVVGSALSVMITALLAYPISRKDFKYRNQFSFIIFFTMLFNGGLVPFYLVYTQLLGLKNNIWVLILPMVVSPFYVLVMRTFFTNNVPDSIIESSRIDGAGEFRTFLQIVLPLSLPGLATIGLFSTLTYWNDWWLSLIFITDEGLVNLQYLMYKVQLNIQYLNSNTQIGGISGGNLNIPDQSARMAMCIIGIGPIIFAYPFFQRFFIRGLTVGAVKG